MDLQARFETLWNRLGGDDAAGVFDKLIAHYREDWRRYHNESHIERCLVELGRIRKHVVDPDALELALFCHDAIYDTKAHDNEQQSAELAVGLASELRLPTERVERIRRLVRVTDHKTPPQNADETFSADIDLVGLADEQDLFAARRQAIRQEYPDIETAVFHWHEQQLFKSLLSRPSIYQSSAFFSYEGAARNNLAAVIAER